MEHDFVYSGIEVLRCNPSTGFSHWHQIYPDDETDLPTSKEGRYNFTCCYYDGKIFMFGGGFGQQVFQDMECFDIGEHIIIMITQMTHIAMVYV